MIDIPVVWFQYGVGEPGRKWDMLWVERMLRGEEGRPPGAYRFVEMQQHEPPMSKMGRVWVHPVGDYQARGDLHKVYRWLQRDLEAMDWCVLIATSDECSTFEWNKIDPWPDNTILWVMTPRRGQKYPPGTRFIGEGCPARPTDVIEGVPQYLRDFDVFFSGQVNHERREQMSNAIDVLATRHGIRSRFNQTPTFLHGENGNPIAKPGGDFAYMNDLTRSWIVPCPSGPCTQDSFRFFEALEAGCIPVVDGLRNDGGAGYWQMLGMENIAPIIEFWRDLPSMAESLLTDRYGTAANISARWQQHKWDTVERLQGDVSRARFPVITLDMDLKADDNITVFVLTSPTPANPDIGMIQEVIGSVQERLPQATIFVGCDGVRDEQLHRVPAYHEFLHRLCCWTLTQPQVVPFIHSRHRHQSGMTREILPRVRTPFLLFMEGDCPLLGEIDFQAVLDEMDANRINHMRFMHEVRVLDDYAYLFLETEPRAGTKHLRTVQFSTRPAVYRMSWLTEMMDTYFTDESRTMIEDVLYGPMQHGWNGPYTNRAKLRHVWRKHRSAVWAPFENIKHSGNLDGRGDDPKYGMFMDYPNGELPEGAPYAGWHGR